MQQLGRWFAVLLIGLSACGQASGGPPPLLAQMAEFGGVPVAVVIEKEFDFGEMTETGTYVHEFVITNQGTGLLEIRKVVPG